MPLMWEMPHSTSNVVILAVQGATNVRKVTRCHLCGHIGRTMPLTCRKCHTVPSNVGHHTGRVMPLLWEMPHGASNVVIMTVPCH